MTPKRSPYILAVITIFIWSFGVYVGRLISIRSQFLLIMVSFFFSACTLGAYFFFQSRSKGIKFLTNFRWSYIFWGSLGYFTYTIPLNRSYRAFGGASEAAILNYTWPIFTVIFTVFIFNRNIKTKSTLTRFLEGLALFLGFSSVILVATEGNIASMDITNPKGIALGLTAGISYGLFSAYSTTIPEENQPTFLFTAILTSLIFISPLGFTEKQAIQQLTLRDIGLSAIAGVIFNGIGYITWTSALRKAKEQDIVSKVASLVFVLPLLSIIIIRLLLGEGHLGQWYFVLALVLIIFSSILAQRAEQIANRLKPN